MEHERLTFALQIFTAARGQGWFQKSDVFALLLINIKPNARSEVQLGPFITICDCMPNAHSWFRECDFLLNNDRDSQISPARKQCSTLFSTLSPLVDLRSAYPLSVAPNSLELSKQDWLLVRPEQHVAPKASAPTGHLHLIQSNLQFCSFACTLLSSSFFFMFLLFSLS